MPERERCLLFHCTQSAWHWGWFLVQGRLVELVKELRNNVHKLMHATEDSCFTSNEAPLLNLLQMPHVRDEEIEAKTESRAVHSTALFSVSLSLSGEEEGPRDTMDTQRTRAQDCSHSLCSRELFLGGPPSSLSSCIQPWKWE